MNKQNYQLEKLTRRKTGYPLATIAYYGPDSLFASKVVVGIMLFENIPDPIDMKKWFAADLDVRKDPSILSEILAYLETFRVRRVAQMDRIIGCPHEEGVDYPMDESCTICPYWEGRDRWSGETS
jgi:hypothetical protein